MTSLVLRRMICLLDSPNLSMANLPPSCCSWLASGCLRSSNMVSTSLNLALVPSNPGQATSTRLNYSPRSFWTGVPVRRSFLLQASFPKLLLVLIMLFFILWASSHTTKSQQIFCTSGNVLINISWDMTRMGALL